MTKKSEKLFEEYRDANTAQAPFDLFTRGLGAGPDDADATAQTSVKVAEKVDAIISKSGIPPETEAYLREILTAEIGEMFANQEIQNAGKRESSMLDVATVGLDTDEKVKNFLRRHGIDIDKDEDKLYISKILSESIEYFDQNVAGKDKNGRITHKAGSNFSKNDLTSVFEIFKTASGYGRKLLIPQACALLRIAACIDFMNSDPLISVLPEAENAIKDVAAKHFKTIKNGSKTHVFQFGDEQMPIYKFEMRTKDRPRIITKLLHKPSNRTKEVLDHIGLRVTTFSAADTVRLIYQMFFSDDAIFPAMSINIAESRNRLLDGRQLLQLFSDPAKAKAFVDSFAADTLEDEELTNMNVDKTDRAKNEHTSSKYRAIHITFDLPIIDNNGKHVNFPVELQVLDLHSSLENGVSAPHETYVDSQVQAVRDRILGGNILDRFNKRND